MTHLFLQTCFVYGTYLFQKYHRITGKTRVSSSYRASYVYMSGQTALCHTAGDSRCNNGRTVTVAYVVLNDKYGSKSPLLASHHGT